MSLWDTLFGTRRRGVPSAAPSPDAPRDLVLYKYDSCPFCQRVFRVIELLELDIEMRDTRMDPEARDTLRGRTGRTTVPCLFIDDQPLFESADIVAWLEAYARAQAA